MPATSPTSPTDPDASAPPAQGAPPGPDEPGTTRLADDLLLVDDPAGATVRRVATVAVAAALAAVALALVVLMQTGPERPETLVTASPDTNEDGTPVATVGAPRPSTTATTVATTDPSTAPADAAPTTTAPVGASTPTTASTPGVPVPPTTTPVVGGPGAPGPGPQPGPQPGPVAVTTVPPPPVTTAPPVTAPPTTPYVPQSGTVHLDIAPDGVGVTGRDQDVRIPVGGRAYWTNHTTRTDLEIIVNGSSHPIPQQHSSLRLDFTQPGTFTWSLVGFPGVGGTITVF